MDPVASGLTILSTIRKGLTIARKLYDAPKELEELQVEVETFASVLNDIVVHSYDLCVTNSGVSVAIAATRACLLKIQQIIEYELVKEVPEGKKARRRAWLRKANDVHDLLEKLADCRANLILAFDGEIRRDISIAAKRSAASLEELHRTVVHKSEDIERSLLEFGSENRRHNHILSDKLERYEQRWEIFTAQLEAQHYQYRQLEAQFNLLLEGAQISAHDSGALEYPSVPRDTAQQRLLLAADQTAEHTAAGSILQKAITRLEAIPSIVHFPSERVLSLMSTCSGSHKYCSGRQSNIPLLPTRVLDVGRIIDDVRLHQPEHPSRAKYVALSYCWGGAASIVTTNSTLAGRKECIPWDIIPSLFQDAIMVTRKLGMRYIWIDTLCIVQDDVEDWERESGKMAEVYGNATLTIAADSTPHPSSRLLLKAPDTASPQELALDLKFTDVAKDARTAYDRVKCHLKNSRLSERAWIVQEQLLAPTVIHFVGGAAIFECNHGISPLLESATVGQLTLRHPEHDLKRLCATLLTQPVAPIEILDMWWRAVEQHSGRKLAFQSDKLVAISGLACRFQAALGPYAAGLWPEYDFVRSLCWRPGFTSSTPPTYTAPTWSWASVDGTVVAPPLTGSIAVATVMSVMATPVGSNKLGALRSAALTLRACCIDLEVKGQDDYQDNAGKHQCLVYAMKGSMNLTFEADNFQSFQYGTRLKCLKILEAEQGDLTCILVTPAGNDSWKRVALVELHRRRGEHRLFGSATETVFTIV